MLQQAATVRCPCKSGLFRCDERRQFQLKEYKPISSSRHGRILAISVTAILLIVNMSRLWADEVLTGRDLLLNRYHGVKARICQDEVDEQQIREAAMVLVWGQMLELFTTEHLDDEMIKELKTLVPTIEVAEQCLADALAAYDAPGDSYTTRRGTFFAAYISTMNRSGQPYLIYIPKTYDPQRAYPLELRPASYVRRYDIPKRLDGSETYIVVAPCGRGQNAIEGLGELEAIELIRHVQKVYNIDPDRIYLTGGSIGGGGVWRLAARYPDVFAAATIEFGWSWTSNLNLENTSNIPLWIYHDNKDVRVPVDESRTAVKYLSALPSPIIYTETSGGGHSRRMKNPNWHMRRWLFQQRRNPFPTTIRYTTETPARGRAYWLEILEFTNPNGLATLVATIRHGNKVNQLFLTMRNIDVLRVDLPKQVFHQDKPLNVAVVGAPLTVEKPLPQRLFVYRSANGGYALAKTDPRGLKPFRPYVPGGLNSMYISGEPLMIVRGTRGDNPEIVVAIEKFCRMLSHRATPWWPFPMAIFIHGKIPVKADVDITLEDIKNHNLILVGPASANKILQRITKSLPAVEAGDSLEIAGETYSLRGNGYGLLYFNPEAPHRLLMVVSSPEPEFFKTVENGITDRMADERPFGLVIRQLGPQRIIREIAWDKNWRIPADAFDAERAPKTHFASAAAFRNIRVRAMSRATGAQYAVFWDKPVPAYFDVAHARWHDIRAAIGQHQIVYVGLASGDDLRILLEANRQGKTDVAFYPSVEPDSLNANSRYTVCLHPRTQMLKAYVKFTEHNLLDIRALRIDLFNEVQRLVKTGPPHAVGAADTMPTVTE